MSEPTTPNEREEAYDLIDRFLRNNLDDTDYADFSQALDLLFVAQRTEPAAPVAWQRESDPGVWHAIDDEDVAAWRQGGYAVRGLYDHPQASTAAAVHDKRCPAALNLSDPCNCGETS